MNKKRKQELILTVDDVPKNIQLLAGMLGKNNYIVSAAMNGKQALIISEKVLPDIILLDVMMPDMTGFEVCKKLKENPKTKDIPVIFLTAKTETEDIIEGFNVGAVDYVTKPFKSEELLTRVRTHLELKRKNENIIELNKKLKQSEEKYRGLYDSSIDSIILIDMDQNIIDANAAFLKLTGYSKDELINKKLKNLSSTTYWKKIEDTFNNQLKNRGFTETYEKDIIKKDLTIIPVETRLWISTDDTEDIICIWELTKDVSERKKAEKMRGDVDRIMRHDLKNPLSLIISSAFILSTKYPEIGENPLKWIKTIHENGIRLNKMIEHSLDIFKMEQNTYEYYPQKCNIINILKDVNLALFDLSENKSVKIKYFLNDNIITFNEEYNIPGVTLLLESMFANLLKNAVEASPKKNIVTVKIKSGDPEEISIHNYGAVDEKIKNTFFEKYVTCNKQYGTGIGTYSAMLIAKTLKGNIKLKSSKSEGTLITVYLPSLKY